MSADALVIGLRAGGQVSSGERSLRQSRAGIGRRRDESRPAEHSRHGLDRRRQPPPATGAMQRHRRSCRANRGTADPYAPHRATGTVDRASVRRRRAEPRRHRPAASHAAVRNSSAPAQSGRRLTPPDQPAAG